MLEDKKIKIGKVKQILYAIQSEFENEVDTIDDVFGREISEKELDFGLELLDNYINKVELTIQDEIEYETKFVRCIIEYDDNATQLDVIIKTTDDYVDDEEDSQIFFYGLSLEEIQNAVKNKTLIENEWRIIKIIESLEEL